jgi:alpha-galactosidase
MPSGSYEGSHLAWYAIQAWNSDSKQAVRRIEGKFTPSFLVPSFSFDPCSKSELEPR